MGYSLSAAAFSFAVVRPSLSERRLYSCARGRLIIQDEFARGEKIDISRQTLINIDSKKRELFWNIFCLDSYFSDRE
jgi:hypothetical protein